MVLAAKHPLIRRISIDIMNRSVKYTPNEHMKAKEVLKSKSDLTLDGIITRLKMVRIDDGSKK